MRRALTSVRIAAPYLAALLAAEHYVRGIVTEMVTVRPEIVDFGVYYRAAQALAAGGHLYAPYTGCCFDGSAMDGYTYPPLLAVVLNPLSALPVGVAGRLFLGASQLCLAGALVLMHLTVRGMVGRRAQAWLLAAVLLFQPIHAGNFGLQVSNLLLLLLAGAAYGVVRGRAPLLSGALVGLGAAIKLTPALAMPALVTRRSRATALAVAGFVAAAVGPTLLAWLVAPETPRYFTDVLPRFAGGVSLQYNRSLPGVVLRTYTDTGHVPPAVWATAFHVLQVAALGATWVWCRSATATPAGRAAVLAAFLALTPITQPVTWDHHMATDALVLVLLAPTLRTAPVERWAAITGMALMCVNELQLTPVLQRHGYDPPHGAGIVVFVAGASVNLAGMALVYASALRAAGRHRSRDAAAGIQVIGRHVRDRRGLTPAGRVSPAAAGPAGAPAS